MSDEKRSAKETAAQASGAGRRRWERLVYQRQLELHLPESGMVLKGHTKDVSLSGLFLETSSPPLGLQEGTTGVLRVLFPQEKLDFPCRLTRVTQFGVAIDLEEKAASFGMAMTMGIFKEMAVSGKDGKKG